MPRPPTIPPMGDTTAEELLGRLLQPPKPAPDKPQEPEKPQEQ